MEIDSVSVIESLRVAPEQQTAMEILTEFSKHMAVMAFLDNATPVNPPTLVKEIYQVCDHLMAGCLRKGTKLPCQKGCLWCCFLRVKATPLEVFGIVDYLHSSQKPGILSALRQRIAATDNITRGMDGHRRICAKEICPLVVGDKCLVYPVRPITCRTYHSLNTSDCEALLDDDQQSVSIRLDISVIGMGLLAGLTEGLRQAGLQTRSLELIAGLRMALDEPESMRRWLAGEPVFSEAEVEGSNRQISYVKETTRQVSHYEM